MAPPAVDMQQASSAFERGLEWFLAHGEQVSADSKMAALGGLMLADLGRVPAVRQILAPARHPNPVAALIAVVESDPLPLSWNGDDTFRPAPDAPLRRRAELHRINGPLCHAALGQACLGKLDDAVLAWLRRDDLCGYDLAHQLLAWILCVKRGHLSQEARATVGRLALRLLRDIERYSFIYYDLFAESLAFLALAGVPLPRLGGAFRHVLALQDGAVGCWRYTMDPAEQMWLLENAHRGGSPLIRAIETYERQPDPLAAFQSLATFHQGHTTSLSLWALGVLLQARPEPRPAVG
jgi:hypothetical protein